MKLEAKQIQVMDFDWFERKPGVNQKAATEIQTPTDWKNLDALAPLFLVTAEAHKMVETDVMTVTELELKTLLSQKKREGQHLLRTELNRLYRAIWRKRRAETRKTFHQDQGECRDGDCTQQKHKASAGGTLATEKLRRVLSKLKYVKGSPDQITADVLKELPPNCLEKLARSLSEMCWDMDFLPEHWMCSLTVMTPKVVGATILANFRPIAGLCTMRKVLGHRWLNSLPPLRYESVQTAFV